MHKLEDKCASLDAMLELIRDPRVSLDHLTLLAKRFAIMAEKKKGQKDEVFRSQLLVRVRDALVRESADGPFVREGSRGPAVRHLQGLIGRPPTGLLTDQDRMKIELIEDEFKLPRTGRGSATLATMLERYGNPVVVLGPWFSCTGCGRNMPKGKPLCFECGKGSHATDDQR